MLVFLARSFTYVTEDLIVKATDTDVRNFLVFNFPYFAATYCIA